MTNTEHRHKSTLNKILSTAFAAIVIQSIFAPSTWAKPDNIRPTYQQGGNAAIGIPHNPLLEPASFNIGAIGLFGSRETSFNNLTPFKRWTEMLARYDAQKQSASQPCSPQTPSSCIAQQWNAVLASLHGQPLFTQLEKVNRAMNAQAYVPDRANWGTEDFWSTPLEFFARQGDCEDYATAKYLALRELGVPDTAMRIVMVMDMNLNIPHAVLVVYTEHGTMILDNQIDVVVPAQRIVHYKPMFSLNAAGWWLHQS